MPKGPRNLPYNGFWALISLAQIDLSLPVFSFVKQIFIWTESKTNPQNTDFCVGVKTDF